MKETTWSHYLFENHESMIGGENQDANGGQDDINWSDIKLVQNLIERCLQQFMTQTEIITALQVQASIEPSLTCLVWQKLEEQNPEFFYSYGIRIKVRDQIIAFNYLVEQQIHYMQRMSSAGINVEPPPEQLEQEQQVSKAGRPKKGGGSEHNTRQQGRIEAAGLAI